MAPPGTPLRPSGNFMNIHGVGTYFIPLRSWHRAQHPPSIRIGIPLTVVEESAIEQNSAQVLPKSPLHRSQRNPEL